MRAVCGLQAKTRRGELRSTVGASWTTTFLHTNGEFQKREPELVSRIRALAAKVNCEEGWSMPVEEGNLRCIEHHEYLNGGGLADHHHRDTGSLVTIDLMLSEASSGGEFCTLEADGLLREHDFHRGDAIVFPSHKPHSVGQITSGRRSVLIVEIWPGLPRSCAHRCVGDPEAACDFGVMDSARENMRYLFAR
ncbi:unnamed protein product [Symbiodinium sp. CCMP2592]|nr:unnamed protein product [Symbiodinium sp. CCMP2592]